VLDEGIPGWVELGLPVEGGRSGMPYRSHGDESYRAVGVEPPRAR
jgi:hypothetical protein